jgi:hypothetical protein
MFSCTLNVTHTQKKSFESVASRVDLRIKRDRLEPGTVRVARGEVNGGGRLIEIFLRDLFFSERYFEHFFLKKKFA